MSPIEAIAGCINENLRNSSYSSSMLKEKDRSVVDDFGLFVNNISKNLVDGLSEVYMIDDNYVIFKIGVRYVMVEYIYVLSSEIWFEINIFESLDSLEEYR
jgi:hypothetical protein